MSPRQAEADQRIDEAEGGRKNHFACGLDNHSKQKYVDQTDGHDERTLDPNFGGSRYGNLYQGRGTGDGRAEVRGSKTGVEKAGKRMDEWVGVKHDPEPNAPPCQSYTHSH